MTTIIPKEWSRGPQWASLTARAQWEPVLQRARAAWSELEIASVSEGLRSAALVSLEAAAEVPIASRDCARAGLQLSPLETLPGGGFRAAVHTPGAATAWYAAWGGRKDGRIGDMLGFPTCCREFFARVWGWEGRRDTLPAMRTVDGPWEANTLLRQLGVRLVPHLPCAGDCVETVRQAGAYLAVGRAMGLDMAAIEALLRLPVSYDALNGLAIITTPHFRLMAAADQAPAHLVRQGEVACSFEDNGFSSQVAMEQAHAAVLEAIGAADSAVDLGCGDGALLARLAAGREGRWVGIEADEGRASRGSARHAPLVRVLHGRIEDPERLAAAAADPFAVALFMPGRLLELREEAAGCVREALPRLAHRLVLYGYGDVLERHGGLAVLAGKAGLALAGPLVAAAGVEAAEGRVLGARKPCLCCPDPWCDGGDHHHDAPMKALWEGRS